MKKAIVIILIAIVLVLVGYSILDDMSLKHRPPGGEIRSAAIAFSKKQATTYHYDSTWEKGYLESLQVCGYKGQTVFKTDLSPTDGPITLYKLDGTEIGYYSIFIVVDDRKPDDPTRIDVAQIENCSNIK